MSTNNSVNVGLSGTTGSGNFVGATSPTLITPNIGTPSAGTLTSCSGLPVSSGISGLGTGVATALAANVTGSGGIALATSPSFTTPTLGAASAASISFSSTTGIIGTTTNDNAAAGSVGEYISSTVSGGSPVSLTTNVVANVTSISLTAGDWDVGGIVGFSLGTGTSVTYSTAAANSTSATLPALGGYASNGTTSVPVTDPSLVIPTIRASLSTTTTYYLVAKAGFTVSTLGAYGMIWARRRR